MIKHFIRLVWWNAYIIGQTAGILLISDDSTNGSRQHVRWEPATCIWTDTLWCANPGHLNGRRFSREVFVQAVRIYWVLRLAQFTARGLCRYFAHISGSGVRATSFQVRNCNRIRLLGLVKI